MTFDPWLTPMLNFACLFVQANGYPDFLIHVTCISHWTGKVLAETAKSVCKSMRRRRRVFKAFASTTSIISSRQHTSQSTYSDSVYQFHISSYFDTINLYTIFFKIRHQPMDPGTIATIGSVQPVERMSPVNPQSLHDFVERKKGWRLRTQVEPWDVFGGFSSGFSQVFTGFHRFWRQRCALVLFLWNVRCILVCVYYLFFFRRIAIKQSRSKIVLFLTQTSILVPSSDR